MKSLIRNTTGRLAKFVAVGFILVGMFSCEREIPSRELLSNYEANSYGEVFKAFWDGMNSNYLFWDQESVNWDSMYRAYKPKFDSLDNRQFSDTTQNLCFQYLADMTKDLKDGQYALQFWAGGDINFEGKLYKSYISFIPKLFRTQRIREALPDTLFDYVIQNNYLNGFDYGIYWHPVTRQPFQIITGRISKGRKDIIYTNLNVFALKEGYQYDYSTRPTRPVIKNLFDNIRNSRCEALIIDLRNNRGGNMEDINFLVGQFTSKTALFGYARYKSGTGRLDYTPPLAMRITPQEGAKDFKKPIIILTDLYSSALCESVIMAFKSLPETTVTIIGERSYGTSGFILSDDISTNGGSFSVGEYATVRMSNTAVQDRNGKFNFSGINPDIEVIYNAAGIKQMLSSGVDIQLEKAIQFINQ